MAKIFHRVPSLRLPIRIVALALLLAMIAAWVNHLKKGYAAPNLSSILAKTEVLHSSLLTFFDTNELLSVPTYLRAQRAIERAQILGRGSHPDFAIPHAQSALALMEQTEADVLRARYNQLQAKAVTLQLELPLKLSNEEEAVDAQIAMQQAQTAASQGEWKTALRLLEHAVLLIRAQGLALEAGK